MNIKPILPIFVAFCSANLLWSAPAPEKYVKKDNTLDLEAPNLDLGFEHRGEGWKGLDGSYWKLTDSAYQGKKALVRVTYAGAKPGAPSQLIALAPVPLRGGSRCEVAVAHRAAANDELTAALKLVFRTEAGKETGSVTLPLPSENEYVLTRQTVDVPAGTDEVCPILQIQVVKPLTKTRFNMFDALSFSQAASSATRPAKALLQLEDANSGKETPGNLSIGKFYTVNPAPSDYLLMQDVNGGRFTAGTKLTDGDRHPDHAFRKDLLVAWRGNTKPVEIIVDLGRPQTLQELKLSGFYDYEGMFRHPDRVEVALRDRADADWKPWQSWSKPEGFNARLQKEKFRAYTLDVRGPNARGRYVRILLTPDATSKNAQLALDEIELNGLIKNTWKYVPKNGSYHGAFTPTYSVAKNERKPGSGSMSLDYFEKLAGKKVAMVLWYQGMSRDRKFAEVQAYRSRDLAENHTGQRFMSLGWLPAKGTRLDDIANGKFDDYFFEYFSDAMNDRVTQGDHTPLWFRPMNEFNAFWVNWGLDPVNFRKAWRRIYNIAEQTGAAERHVFVWSPNHRSYPDEAWNKMENYYPGDQYVDWVGVSAYPPSRQYVESDDARYVTDRCKEVNAKYGDRKPMMIAEGGYDTKIDRSKWVREWFAFQKTYPNFKSMIWENHHERVLQSDDQARALYRELVQSPYWVSETWLGEEKK